MSDKALRTKLIRLANARPELREHLLPLLKTGAPVAVPTTVSEATALLMVLEDVFGEPRMTADDPGIDAVTMATNHVKKALMEFKKVYGTAHIHAALPIFRKISSLVGF